MSAMFMMGERVEFDARYISLHMGAADRSVRPPFFAITDHRPSLAGFEDPELDQVDGGVGAVLEHGDAHVAGIGGSELVHIAGDHGGLGVTPYGPR